MTTKEILRPLPGYPEDGGAATMLTRQNPKKKAGGIDRVEEHRGLRRSDIVGRTEFERGLRWSLFKRGEWPPAAWKIPATLEGVALLQMIEERSTMYVPAWKAARGKGRA